MKLGGLNSQCKLFFSIEGLVLSLYGSAPAFSLLGLKWWIVLLGFAVPLLFFLFVPLLFKERKSFLRLVKKDRE